jgi:hypothetical protein
VTWGSPDLPGASRPGIGVGHGAQRSTDRRTRLVFLGGLAAVNQAAPQGRRADVLSSFYVIIYLGVGVPAIGVGFLATTAGLQRAVQYFAGAAALLCLLLLTRLTRPHREIPAAATPPARPEALAARRGRNG